MKSVNNSWLLIVFTFIISSVHAQQTTSSDTLCFCREKVNLNNKVLHYKEMKSLLTKYPSSSLEFKRYMRGASWGTLALFTGIAGGVVALARIPKKILLLTAIQLRFSSGTALGLTIFTATKKHLRRSVMLYNKEVLK